MDMLFKARHQVQINISRESMPHVKKHLENKHQSRYHNLSLHCNSRINSYNMWMLTDAEESSLDGTYVRLLRMALNISWRDHRTNNKLYGWLLKVSTKICESWLVNLSDIRMRRITNRSYGSLAVVKLTVEDLLKPLNYIDCQHEDTGAQMVTEIKSLMTDHIH